MGQVLHRYPGDASGDSRMEDGLARFMIDVLHAPRLLARDLQEFPKLGCVSRAIVRLRGFRRGALRG